MRVTSLALVFAWIVLPAATRSQGPPPADSTARTTLSGVYSAEQAARGKDSYGASCEGCHTTASHSGDAFLSTWEGKPLWELFQYMQQSMPKSEPGILSVEEYAQLTAYILQLNGMPDGPQELPADSAALSAIKVVKKPA